ncbi:hypothetical protein ACLB2K_067795 [Fragaria x ananassa]
MTSDLPTPPYDLIILGASGFTGKYVVKEALKFRNTPSSPLTSLALAGRNPTKLSQTLTWAAAPIPPPPSVPILTADPHSLRRLCSQTRLVLNCVGPFRLYGEPVVAACVESGCDYLDICGEPEFMERMEASYFEKAAEKGSLVISACGFDSVPAELGVMFNSRQILEFYLAPPRDPFPARDEAGRNRRSRPKKPRPQIPGPPPSKGPIIEHQKKIGLWAVKLPSADAIVVRRTLGALTENPGGLPGRNETDEHIKKREAFWSIVKPAHFGVKIGTKSLLGIIRIMIVGLFLGLLGQFSFGRWLLLKFPSFFSVGWFRKEGPSDEEVRSASFKMWFVGRGFSDRSLVSQGNTKPDKEIVTRVMGPEIGYLTTPIILLQCALIVLSQRDDLPKGGVLPAGIVFGPTDLQERLQENGVTFDVISKNAISH